ncbi:hypothetical protein BDQ94DRAFT_177494 [Aspergillus welwitschiae]|uniref:Uncharacterized protein n=1 Tax=Aspergillus welwitschiae TaxID=1341132 RepID=A0A3F3PHV7_9EURO|nr:hypothetical protein BDQ94DRAFT_177494 [Aspergillus welwitschiae]RDH26509.1 hypothetical protein BDQ94DRAFT_177494 [Aspergillus welwitschiae]
MHSIHIVAIIRSIRPHFLTWNGPSILSPLTHPKDAFRHTSVMLLAPIDWLVMHLTVVHKHTSKSVTVSPLFLSRVKCALVNLGHYRKQIWEVIRPYMRTIDHADHGLLMLMWPRGQRDPDTLGRFLVFPGTNLMDARKILDLERFVENISGGS